MSAVCHCEIIVAAIQHPLPCIGIIGSDILQLKGQRHSGGFAWSELLRLAEVHQLYGRFLRPALRVRRLDIQLHSGFAGYIAGIGDRNGRGTHSGRTVDGQVIQRLLKRGIAESITKGIADLCVVIPGGIGVIVRIALHIFRGVGIVESLLIAGHGIRVTGLIILVAHINAFVLHYVPVGLAQIRVGLGGAAVGGRIRPGIQTHIGIGRGRCGMYRVSISQMAGRIGLAGQHIHHALKAIGSGQADPENGVNALIGLEIVNAHSGIRIDQDNHLIKGIDRHINDLLLISSQIQRRVVAVPVIRRGGIDIIFRSLRCIAGDDNDGRIAVLANRVFAQRALIRRHACAHHRRGRNLTNDCVHQAIILRAKHKGRMETAGGVARIELHHGRVDRDSCCFQSGLERHDLRSAALRGAGPDRSAIYRIEGPIA